MNERTIIMEGYDRRVRESAKFNGRYKNTSSSTWQTNRANGKKETVTSWRSSVGDEPVLSSAFDPYAFLLDSARARRESLARQTGAYGSNVDGSVPDNGHPFLLERHTTTTSHPGQNYLWWNDGGTSGTKVGGPLIVANCRLTTGAESRMLFGYGSAGTIGFRSPSYPVATPLTSLANEGKRFINLTSPGQPSVDMPAMLGELLLDPLAIPLKGFASNKPFGTTPVGDFSKRTAGEFLNFAFGVSPTVNDLVKFGMALSTLTDRILQFERDLGKPVRRKMRLPQRAGIEVFENNEVELQGQIFGGLAPGFSFSGTSSSGTNLIRVGSSSTSVRQTLIEDTWFSASFRYFVPASAGLHANAEKYLYELNRQIKITNSVSAMWQVTPWSWLIDWFLDVQSSLALAEKVWDDSLVINYAYAMRKVIMTSTVTVRVTPEAGKTIPAPEVSSTLSTTKMERIRANPYGFISPNSPEITPFRLAIMAALGISRRSSVN